MPVARIYASLVEEAEPICADLLARGYNVEVVFPDAVLPTPADLELRVERCSAEQAIARVEGNDASRSVFVTRGKGPRNELLLVEMTVLATGTDGRHPILPPTPLLVSSPTVSLAQLAKEAGNSATDNVLAFPVEAKPMPEAAVSDAGDSKGEFVSPVDRRVFPKSAQVPGRNMMAELNEFLAHAPVVKRRDGLHVRVFETVRQSVSVERARKNWEGLTLAGVAAGFLCLLSLGWYAAPNLPRRAAVSEARPAAASSRSTPVEMASGATLQPAAFKTATLQTVPRMETSQRKVEPARSVRIGDDLVAEDHIVRMAQEPGKIRVHAATRSTAPARPATTAELVQPAAMRSAPIKHITDLK